MRINMNGVDDGIGKHMALFIHLMRGDYDDFLQWPFAKNVRLSILDQSEGEPWWLNLNCKHVKDQRHRTTTMEWVTQNLPPLS